MNVHDKLRAGIFPSGGDIAGIFLEKIDSLWEIACKIDREFHDLPVKPHFRLTLINTLEVCARDFRKELEDR